MNEKDSWTVFEDTEFKDAESKDEEYFEKINELASTLSELVRQKDSFAEHIVRTEKELLNLLPHWEIGTVHHRLKDFNVTISQTESWSWDKNILKEIFNEYAVKKLPEYMKLNFSIDKNKFDKLPDATKNQLRPALTRKGNKPKMKVTPNV